MTNPLLTVAEVADSLRVHPMTVRRWIDNGALTAIRVGRDFRIESTELDAYIERNKTTPA